jgi:elongation factor 2
VTNRLKTDVSPTTGKKLKRGFCQFVLAPIYRIVKGCLGGPEKREQLDKNIQQLGIELKAADKALEGKDLMKCVMPKFLPLGTVRHLCRSWVPLSQRETAVSLGSCSLFSL